MLDIVGVQLLEGGKVQYYLTSGLPVKLDSLCVVETEHGPSMGRVVKTKLKLPDAKETEPLRRILREAQAKDMEQVRHNTQLEREAFRLCRQLALDKGLSMKLVDVAYSLDARKAVFYFTSENRVDFRELVKELAHTLKVKIEMRQIGVRDEARRLGGVGCCGQSLCCCTFLKDFVSVSIRMAKDQNVSLNPTKVSGICGRLMCCLSYEYDGSKAKGRKVGKENEKTCAQPGAPCPGCQPPEEPQPVAGEPRSSARPDKPESAAPGETSGTISKNQPGNPNRERRWFRSRPGKKPEGNAGGGFRGPGRRGNSYPQGSGPAGKK
jgi:cell fate regulator YaaT (PSP1 superfamily)